MMLMEGGKMFNKKEMVTAGWFYVAMIISSLSICYAQVPAPVVRAEIISIEGNDHVLVEWERVEDAEFYIIYSSNEPFSDNWGEPVTTVGDSVYSYIEAVEGEVSKFFYVTAYITEETMVLVDGDLFLGTVLIDPFYLSKYQVTQELYFSVMGYNPSHFADEQGNPNAENLPVECVSWFDAVEFCNRLSMEEGLTPVYSYLDAGTDPDDWYRFDDQWNAEAGNHRNVSCDWDAEGYRLPTEAEWEHAANDARFPARYAYAGSNNIDEVAWYAGNSHERTHPVGTKVPNGLDIYDLSGNVVEWCWDKYGMEFPSGGDNPRGPEESPNRMGRGGNWRAIANLCENDVRVYGQGRSDYTTRRSEWLGFRVAKNAPERR